MLRQFPFRAPQNAATILALLLLAFALLVAGGASRADQLAQPVVRGVALLAVIVILAARQPIAVDRTRPILILLGCAALLCLVQLIPLPPALWYALGGRGDFAALSGQLGLPQIWRPLSLTPDLTLNALFSLSVPFAMAMLVGALTTEQLRALLPAVLLFVGLSGMVGLIQFGNNDWTNPLLNQTLGDSSGVFANRNHQALFLAIGLLLLPPWAMRADWRLHWMRSLAAVGLVPFFLLMILATGSRAGLILATMALALSLWISSDTIASLTKRPKVALIALATAGFVAIGGMTLMATRTRAMDRLLSNDAAEDFRFRALPTVRGLISEYFPWGSGLGSFDSTFRAAEPLALLKPTYFNHAHNDFAELLLETGILGAVLLIGAIVWVAVRAASAQSAHDRHWRRHARTGASIIVLVMIASAVDYPARIPIYMALLVVAAAWLQHPAEPAEAPMRR